MNSHIETKIEAVCGDEALYVNSFSAYTIEDALEKLKTEHNIIPAKKRNLHGVFTGNGIQIGFMHYGRQNIGGKMRMVESWVTFKKITVEFTELPEFLKTDQ